MSFAVNTASKLLLVDNRILQVDHSWLTHLTNNTDYLVYDFLNDSREDLENAITSLSKTFDYIGICFYNENTSSTSFQLLNSMESSPIDSACSAIDWQYTIQWFQWIVQTIQCSSIELIPYFEVENQEDWIHIAELLASSLPERISISNSTINSFFDISISTPYTKLILIDDRISDIETGILSSLTHDTAYIIFNYETDALEIIKEKILAFGVNFYHVSIAQHGIFDSTYRLFSNMGEATLKDVETADPELTTWEDYRLFLGWLKTNVQTQYFDLLACYIWSNRDWRYIIENLREDMYIRASVDITGSGGNFILESDNVDTIGIYFTREILRYKYSFISLANAPTVSGIIRGFRRYKFNYNQIQTTGVTIVGFSYELFKNGTLAANSVRKQMFSPYEVASVSPYKSISTNIQHASLSSYGIKKIQIIKTSNYKRMYFLVSSLSVDNPEYRSLYYYNWNSSINNWDTTTTNFFTDLHSYTSCFRFSPDGTRCVLATAPPSFTGAYVYYLDYSYSPETITIIVNPPVSAVINSIQFTGCDINDNKTTIFACYSSNSAYDVADNGFYYSKYSDGSYGNLINAILTFGKKYDIICNASGNTVITSTGAIVSVLNIYDLSGSLWVSRKIIPTSINSITGVCFGGSTRSENMILTTNFTMTNSSIAGYSVKYFDASLSFSALSYLSNTNGEPAPGNGLKSIAFDPDPSGNGIYVVLDGNSSIHYTTLDYVTNYITSPSPTSGSYTACNLNSGSYTMKLTTTGVDANNIYSSKTSTMTAPVTVYDAPTVPTFTQVSEGGFNKIIKMYYTKPASDGSSNITKYQYSLDDGTIFKTMTNASGVSITTDGSYTIVNDASINPGTQYIMRLRAINADGASGDVAIDSDYTTPAPYTYPDAPDLSYTLNTPIGAATITAVCLYNGGSISTSYKYRISPSYEAIYDSSSGVDTFTFPSTNRTYRYYTQNASVSSLSYTSILIQTPPLPPTLSLSIITQKQIIMTYTDASYTVPGKLPITNYKYSLDNVTYTTIAYSPSGSYTIENVTPGIRTVYLKTTNGTTDSDSAIQSIEVYSLPNYSPIITNIFHDDGTLTVTYEYNGEEYNPITTYLYSISGDISNNYVDLNTATPSPFVLTNVAEPITIYMKARNYYGDSIARSYTTSLGESTDLYVITGYNKALVSFVPPSYVQNTITGYLYSTDYGQTYYPAIVSNDSFMVNNLISGVTYKVYLIATDVNGYGSVAVTNSFTPINDFSVSSELRDTYGIFTITDSMAKTIEITIGGNTQTYASSLDNTYYFGGLLNSTQYSVTVTSYNDIGQLSSQTFEIKTLPASPVITNCTVSIPQSKVTVTFNESVSNGYPVTSYKYSLDDISYTNIQFNEGVFEFGIDTSKTKKYTLYLRAVNAYNDSQASIVDFNVGNPPLTAAANLANVSCRESNKIYFEITNYESNSTYQYAISVTSGIGPTITLTSFVAGTFSLVSSGRYYNIIRLGNDFINPTVTLTIRNNNTRNNTVIFGLFVYTNIAPSGVTVSPVNAIRELKITFTPNAPANYKYRLTSSSPIYDICNNLLTPSGTSKIYNIINDPSMVGGGIYNPIIYGASGTYTISQVQYPVLSAGVVSSGNAIVYDIPSKPRSVNAISSGSTMLLTYGCTFSPVGISINNYKYRYDSGLSYTNLTGPKPTFSFNISKPTTENINVTEFKDTSEPFTIYVACDNSFGTSPDASFTFSPSNYPYKNPEPPSSVSYIIDNSRATFTVITPKNNGKPITKYRYQLTPTSASGDISGTYVYDQSYTLNIDVSSNTVYRDFKLWTYSASGGYSTTAYTTALYSTPNKPSITDASVVDLSSNSYIRFTYTPVTPGTIGISEYVYYLTSDLSRISMGSNSRNDTSYNIYYENLTLGATYNIKIAALDNCGNYSEYSDPITITFNVSPDIPSLGTPTEAINMIYFPFTIPDYTGGFPIQKYTYTIRSINSSNVILDRTYDSSKGLYYTNPLNELTINSYTSGANAWNVSSVKNFQIVNSLSSTKCYVLTFPANELVGTPQLYASQYSSGVWGTFTDASSDFPNFPTTATCFRFSRDGSYAIVGCMNDPSFCLYKYTLSNGTYIRSTISIENDLSLNHIKIDISTDGNVISSISSSGLGYSRNGNAYQLLDNINNYTGIAVSHDGTRIVVCTGINLYVRIWNGTIYESIIPIGTTTTTNSGIITDIRYNFDSTYLFTNKYTYSIFDSTTNTHSTFNDMTRVNKLYDTVSLQDSRYPLITVDVDASNSIYGTVSGSQITSYVYKMFTNTFINPIYPINYYFNPDMSYTITSFQTYNGYTYSNPVNLSGNYYNPLRNGVPTNLSGIGRGNLEITFKNSSNIISGYSYKLDISGGSNTQYDVSLSSLTESSLDSNGKYTYLYIVPNTYPGSFYKIQNLKTYISVEGINTYESDAYSISMNNYIYVYSIPTAPLFNCIGKTNIFDVSLNQLSSSVDTIIRYEYSINNGIDFKSLRDSFNVLINTVGRYNNIIDPSLNYAQSYKIQIRAVTQYTTGDVGKDSNYIKILRSSTSPTQLTTDSSYQKFKINFKEPSLSGSSIIQKYSYRIDNVSGGTFTGDISANSDTYTDPSNLFQLGIYTHTGVDWNPLTYEKIQVVGDRVYVLTHNTSQATGIPRLIYYTNSGGIWSVPSDSNITLEFNTNLFKFTNDSRKLIYTSMAYVKIYQYVNSKYLWSMYANGFLYIALNNYTSNIIKYRVNNFGNIITAQDSITIFEWGNSPLFNDIMYYNNNNNIIIYKKDKSVYTTSLDSPIFTGNNTLPDMSGNVEAIYFSNKLNTIYYLKKIDSSPNNINIYSYNMTNGNTSSLNIPYNTNSISYYNQINGLIQKLFVFTLNNTNFIGYKSYRGRLPEGNDTSIYLQDNLNTPIQFVWSIGTSYNLLDCEIFEDYIIGIFGTKFNSGNLYTKFYKLYNFNLLTNIFTEEFLFDYIDINTTPSTFYYSYNESANMFYNTYNGDRWSEIKYIPSNNSINLYDTDTFIKNTISPLPPLSIELITFLDIDITSKLIAACYVENNICKLMYVDHTNPSYPIIIIAQPPITKIYSAVALSQNSQYLSVAYSDGNNNNLVDVYTYVNSVFTFTGSFFINTNMPIYSMRYNADTTMLFLSTNGTNMFFSCYVDSSGYLIGVTPYNTIGLEEPYAYSHPYPNNIPNIINQPYNSIGVISNVKYTSIDVSGNSIYLFPYCNDVPTTITIVPYLFKVDLTPHSTDSSFISLEKTNLAENNGLPYVVNIKAINYDNIESSGSSINAYAYDNPSPPTFTITPSYEKLQINFTRPLNDGSTNIIAYNYTISGDSNTISGTYTLQGDPITGTFDTSDCTPGVSYQISLQTKSLQVDDFNNNLLSIFSTPPIPGIAYTLPNPPTTLSMIPTKEVNSFDISFNKITDDSSDAGYTTISGYKYSISDGAYTSPYIDASYHELYDGRLSFRISSINYASLSPSTNYTVYLKSVNAAGVSDSSSTTNATNYGVPSPPMFDITPPYNGHAIGGFMKITVSFNKVTSDDPVKTYKIGISGEEWYDEINDGSYNDPVVYELTADDIYDKRRLLSDTSYNIKIIATNSRGDSIATIDSSLEKVLTIPSVPTDTNHVAGLEQITLYYNSPTDTGGGTPDSYLYYLSNSFIDESTISDASYSIITPSTSNGAFIDGSHNISLPVGINVYIYMKVRTITGLSYIYGDTSHPVNSNNYLTPYTYPQSPHISQISPITTTSARLDISFNDTSANRGYTPLTNYSYILNGGGYTDFDISSTYNISYLSSSTMYNIKIYSKNAAGYSLTENSYNFITVPIPPTIVAYTNQPNRIDLSINTTDPNIVSYSYTCSGTTHKTGTFLYSDPPPYIISDLSAGSYSISVTANNGTWDSSASVQSGIQVFTYPPPPNISGITTDSSSAIVILTPPINDSGRDIKSYGYYNADGGISITDSSTGEVEMLITGLNSGLNSSYRYNYRFFSIISINSEDVRSNVNMVVSFSTNPLPPIINTITTPSINRMVISLNPPSYTIDSSFIPITNYSYRYYLSDALTLPSFIDTPDGSLPTTIDISGISAGYYKFEIKSFNGEKESIIAMNDEDVRVYTKPLPPVFETVIGSYNKIDVSFSQDITPIGTGNSDISGFYYTLIGNSQNRNGTLNSSSRSITLNGIPAGNGYQITLQTINTDGAESDTNPTVTGISVYTIPSPPTFIQSPSAEYMKVTFSFTPPSYDGNTPITSYKYAIQKGNNSIQPYISIPTASAEQLITIPSSDLSYGYTYTVYVRAVNLAGESTDVSATTTGVVYNIPTAPLLVNCSGDLEKIIFTYRKPADDGSNNIQKYQYSLNDNSYIDMSINNILITADGSYTIYANQPNNIRYGETNSVKLVAINQAGSGEILDMTTNPVPYTYPPPPNASILDTNITDKSCTIILTSNGTGGNPFDSYWYKYKDSNGNEIGNYINAGNQSTVNITFTDLSASTQYYLNFYTKNQSGVYSNVPTDVSFITRPSKPIPTITTNRINEITFQYTIPQYDVPLTIYKYYVTNNTNYDISGEVDATNTPIDISGIPAGNYTFTMQVYNGTWYSEDSSQNPISVYDDPSSPSINSFIASYESIYFAVSPPTNMGNSDISGYLYAFSSSPQEAPFDTSYTFTNTSVNHISQLIPGIPIYLFVKATNQKGGISEPVRSNGTVTPYTLPTIAGITLTRNTNTPFSPKIDVSFNADNNSGYTPTTSYQYSVNGSSYTPLPNTTIRSFTIDTSQGTIYDISMIAVNAAGQSSPINAIITQYSLPSPPSFNETTVGGYNKITFSFNSSPVVPNTQIDVVKYQYSIDSGTTYIDISNQGGYILSGSYEITLGVTAGQYYTVNLRSFNNIGYSSPVSDTSSVLVYTTPGIPSTIITTASFECIDVSYTPPVLDGSNAIYKYQYVVQESSIPSSPADACYNDVSIYGIFTIDMFNPTGLSYNVYVRAVNAAGAGSPIKSTPAVTPYTYPYPPTITNIITSASGVFYDLTAPINTGYTPITGYYYKKNISDSSYILINGGTDGSQSINDLSDSTAYQYYVYSKNAGGYSQSSTILPFTTLPYSPTIQNASCIFPNQISILCEYPSNPPIEIISFRFEVWQTDSNIPTTKISDSSFNKNPQNRYVILNIPQYTRYALRAFSYNGINESVYSEQKDIDVFTTPSPPTLGTLTAGKESITFSFTPISTSGGRDISGYKYSTDDFVTSTIVTTSPVTFSSTPGIPVNVKVKSINNEGFDSSDSNTFGTSVIPYTNPSPPTITQITPTYVNNQNTFIIYYTAGASGYRDITNYYYSTDSGSTYTAMNVTADGSYTIPTSFTLGTTYNFQIKSQNSVGLDSSGSNIIVATSLNVPSSPSIVSLSGGYEKILFRFSGSSFNGGTPIIKYQYSISGDTLSSLQDISSGGQYQMSGDYIINNVTAGKNYHLYLYANNIVGNSSPGISGSVMAYTKPYAPSINTNTITTTVSSATGTIIAPANFEEQGYSPITHYSYRESGTTAWTDVSYTSGNMTLYISSLPPSKTYTYQIAAKNIADYSNTTDISFTTNPLPPTITNITASYESIYFTFTASTTNGNNLLKHSVAIRDISENKITNYVDMSSSQNSGTYNVNRTMFTSSELTVGKSYSILLKCTNQAGKESTAIESSTSVVPYTLPNTPSVGNIETTSTSIKFRIGSLSSPDNGYSEIQNYYYYHKGVQYSCTPNTDILLSDLSSSTSYQIGRSATNAAGTSPTVNEPVVTNPGTPKFTVTPRRLSLDISYSLERPLNEGTADSSGFYYSVSGGTYSVETYIAGSDANNTGTFNIPSLTAGTPYQIKLIKKLKNGKISEDAIFYNSSIYPYTYASPPIITDISGLSSTSLHIDFTSPSSLSTRGYTTVNSYKYEVSSNGISSVAQISNINDMSFNLTDLSAGTTYSIRMLTNNTAGDGSYSAFSDGYTLPNYPIINSAEANGDRTIRVVYSAPINGDLPITYKYALDSSASGQFRTMGNSPHDISGLDAGHIYTLYFLSTNREGSSSIYTYPATVIPYTLPDAPIFTSLTQSGIGIGQLRITFSPPTPLESFKPILYYYYLSKSTQPDTSGIISPTNYDISGLTPGIDYEITLYSVNGAGQTASVNKRTLTPYTYPSGITVNSVVAGYNKIIVSINPPTREEQGYDINGIDKYEYTLDNGTNYSPLINYEITGLTAGQQYNVKLRSVNQAGNSPLTTVYSIIPYTIPNSPLFTTEPKSPTSITVTYTPYINDSSNAGYTTISRYEYSINNGVSYPTAPSSPFDISGLIPSTDYTIRMRSFNAAGYSLGDTSSNATTISAIPTIVSAVPSINSIIVKYKASALNGISPITGYRITLTNSSTLNQTIYNISGGAEGAADMCGNYTYTISDISATNYNVNLQTLNKSQKYSEKTPDSFSSVYTYPSSPNINNFTSTTNIVTVHFLASSYDGNSSPLTYWYSIDTDTSNIQTTTKNPMINPDLSYNSSTGVYSYQLTNLTKYTPYYVALYARNAAGVFSRLETDKSKIMFLDGSSQDISINTLPITAIPVFPTNTLTATAYRNSVQLNFNIPTNTGFTGYRYKVINTTTGGEIINHTLNSAIHPIVISELSAGTPILVRLTAYNSFGDSITLESTPNPVTPYQPPAPISSIIITPTQDSQIYRAEFTHPFDGGAQITGYYYKFTNETSYTQLSSPTTTSFVFNTNNNDNAITISMYARNIAGDSLLTNQTLGERTIPDSPIVSLVPLPDGFEITITKPTNDGNTPITGYKFSISNQVFDPNGNTIYYDLPIPMPTDGSQVVFSLLNGRILRDTAGTERTISINTNILYYIYAIAANRLGDSAAQYASGYSYGTPSSPIINGISFVENAILIYFNEGNQNGSTTLGIKYSLNEQPYTYIANDNFSTISPLVIYTTTNVDFTIKLITVSNNGDSIPVISNAVNIPDPYSSNIRQTISSGDKIEALNALALMNDMLETEHGAIESDNNTNIMKFVNNVQDFTSSISAQGSLQNIPLYNDTNIRVPYPNKATILVRKYYQKQLNKKNT